MIRKDKLYSIVGITICSIVLIVSLYNMWFADTDNILWGIVVFVSFFAIVLESFWYMELGDNE